jgi:hypothetical protein
VILFEGEVNRRTIAAIVRNEEATLQNLAAIDSSTAAIGRLHDSNEALRTSTDQWSGRLWKLTWAIAILTGVLVLLTASLVGLTIALLQQHR